MDIEFETRAAQGKMLDYDLTYSSAVSLPRCHRLTGSLSDVEWNRVATASINVLYFDNIVQLELQYSSDLAKWKSFQVGSADPKEARSMEKALYAQVCGSASAAGLTPPISIDRSQHILSTINMKIRKAGQNVDAQKYIKDLAADLHMGSAAITRVWIFEQYESLHDSKLHSTINSQQALPSASAISDMQYACKDCGCQCLHSVQHQKEFAAKGCKNIPSRCAACHEKFRERASKTLCSDFVAGHCRFGDKCRHSHAAPPDAASLPSASENPSTPVMSASTTPDKIKKWIGVFSNPCVHGDHAPFTLTGTEVDFYASNEKLVEPLRCLECRRIRSQLMSSNKLSQNTTPPPSTMPASINEPADIITSDKDFDYHY